MELDLDDTQVRELHKVLTHALEELGLDIADTGDPGFKGPRSSLRGGRCRRGAGA
jgi:hypothetical protein